MTPKFSKDFKLVPEQAIILADIKLEKVIEDPETGAHIMHILREARDSKVLFTIAFRMGYGMALHDVEDGVLKMVKDN